MSSIVVPKNLKSRALFCCSVKQSIAISPLAFLLFSFVATTLVSGFCFYSGYKNNNNNRGGGGHGGGDHGGHWNNKWSDLNTKQHSCITPNPIDKSYLNWFFAFADGGDMSVPLSNYHFKLSFADKFLGRPVRSLQYVSRMNMKSRYDLHFPTYYIVTYTGFGNKKVVINCTFVQVGGSSGSCVPVPEASSPGTNLTILNPSSAWAVYQNETLGVVVAIACLGEIETGTASWFTYSLYDNEFDLAVLHDIYDSVTIQYGLSWL